MDPRELPWLFVGGGMPGMDGNGGADASQFMRDEASREEERDSGMGMREGDDDDEGDREDEEATGLGRKVAGD
ncbi:hypothetical protein EWM64_g10509 [Hericium alpestre]|uniref:Uncharacterized protein n=1 Tax=Hericium alpestre TaxID=135208 RepID=A0A4Y9ZI52_9AGAM|nr:hypothetical protein EWM64_g10509 [Hericium alpestre]